MDTKDLRSARHPPPAFLYPLAVHSPAVVMAAGVGAEGTTTRFTMLQQAGVTRLTEASCCYLLAGSKYSTTTAMATEPVTRATTTPDTLPLPSQESRPGQTTSADTARSVALYASTAGSPGHTEATAPAAVQGARGQHTERSEQLMSELLIVLPENASSWLVN